MRELTAAPEPGRLAECARQARSRRSREGRSIGRLRHVVPDVDAVSARRLHQAGRALCENTRERQLGDPTPEHATCISCVTYTARIRRAAPA